MPSKAPNSVAPTAGLSAGTVTFLILAASRRGAEDSVARLQGVSHKCLVTLDGMVMLERVVREALSAKRVGRVVISIEDESVVRQVPYLASLLDAGQLTITPSATTLTGSVEQAVALMGNPWPLVIGTADNALHTAEMIDDFCTQVVENPMDVGVGMTRADIILQKYPNGNRAFHRLRDAAYSSCNLYALKSAAALGTAQVFRTGGQFGKKPRRILKSFGLRVMLLYKLKLATLDGLTNRLSRRFGLRIKAVLLPYAEGPIDVDNPADFALTEEILQARRQQTEAA